MKDNMTLSLDFPLRASHQAFPFLNDLTEKNLKTSRK